MLVLSRRTGEAIKIGDEVTVTVLGVRGTQIRLGFAAPQDLAVYREEIYVNLSGRRSPDDSARKPIRNSALIR